MVCSRLFHSNLPHVMADERNFTHHVKHTLLALFSMIPRRTAADDAQVHCIAVEKDVVDAEELGQVRVVFQCPADCNYYLGFDGNRDESESQRCVRGLLYFCHHPA